MNNPLIWIHSLGPLCRRTYRLLLFTLLCCLPSIASTQPSVKVATAAQLAEDTRLQRKITLDETGIPLQDLFRKLSNSDLSLSAGRSCADLKLQIRLKQRPLHILLHSLAQLLPGYWEPLDNKKGYRLSMNGSAISRRENWWHLFLSERERAKAEQQAYLLRQMRGEPYRRKPGDPNPENSDIKIEEERAAEHDFFRMLSPSIQEKIVNQQTDCPLYSVGIANFGTEYDEGPITVPLASLPTQVQEQLVSKATAIFSTGTFAFDFENAVVNFTCGGFAVAANVVTASGRDTGTAFSFTPWISPDAQTLTLDHQLLAMEVKRRGQKAPHGWKKLAAYQESRVWKNAPPPKRRTIHPNYSRVEVLHWLRDKADLEYVSDYYGHGGNPMPPQAREAPPVSPLKEELDFLAAERDLSWKQRADSIYLLRNNRWYRDDFLEVPAPLLKRWYTRQQEELTQQEKAEVPSTLADKIKRQMDWHSEILNSITLWQIVTGLRSYVPESFDSKTSAERAAKRKDFVSSIPGMPDPSEKYPFRYDADMIMRQLNTTRFYASLNDNARDALIAGQLPFSALTRQQQEKALYLLPRLRAHLLQQRNPTVFLHLQPKSEGAFRQNRGSVRLTFASSPLPQ